ncbi:MAG: hypothetical protein Q9200_000050 [Gallowayella weberi]
MDNFIRIVTDRVSHKTIPGTIGTPFNAPNGKKMAMEAVLTGQNTSESMFAASLRMSAQTSDTWNNVQSWRFQKDGTAVCTNCARILIAPVPAKTQRFVIHVVLDAAARRYESSFAKDNDTSSTGHAASAGKHKPTHHGHHPEPLNEPLGRGFYIAIAALPLSFALYKLSRATDGSSTESAQPWLTRMIRSYDDWQKSYAERNAMHTKMVEQAGHDRNLFINSTPSPLVDLSFPEIFNTGSPYNVPAGHGANLDELINHYRRKNAEQDAKTRARMEAKKEELKPRDSATLSGVNPKGTPSFSAVSPKQ